MAGWCRAPLFSTFWDELWIRGLSPRPDISPAYAFTQEDTPYLAAADPYEVVGWTAEIVRHPPKLVPDEVMKIWVREWAKEGVELDREKLQEPKYPRAFLPRRWIVERTFSWLGQNRRMSKDYERLPESGEAFIYVAMSRLMLRRLARS